MLCCGFETDSISSQPLFYLFEQVVPEGVNSNPRILSAMSGTKVSVPVPVFDGEKRYDRYIQEVNVWCAVQHGVADKDKAVILAL